MEKLQAALARAREKRDAPDAPRKTGPELSARSKSRNRAFSEAIASRWMAIPAFEPDQRRMEQARVVSSVATGEAMHFDILRTKLLLEMRRHGWTRIAITSATPGSGKTTAACNIAAGLCRQTEVRGMLFDLDLRRPSVAKFFGAEPPATLPDVMTGNVAFEDQALRLGPNVILSLTTRPVPDPGSVLLRASATDTLDAIQKDYQPDIMIFDLPPVLVSDEARAFLKAVDAAIIVAGADTTTVSQIDECEREVADYTHVAGVVLNKCRFMEEGYGYSY